MNFKKRVNGSWVDTPNYIHNTSTDTITTLPAVIHPTGTTATVGLKGNMIQSSTPTSDNPIMPQDTGERTGNLFDEMVTESGLLKNDGTVEPSTAYKTSGYCKINTDFTISLTTRYPTGRGIYFAYYTAEKQFLSKVDKIFSGAGYREYSYSPPVGTEYIRFSYLGGSSNGDKNVMLNLGSTALPYEPYGYKIPISSANTTTPVYLGEVETTRRIKKLVLTGEEGWQSRTDTTHLFYLILNAMKTYSPCIASHYIFRIRSTASAMRDGEITTGLGAGVAIWIKSDNYTTVADFKAYLAQQYTNGTPVTVWYVLATEETGIVNEPLRKIGDYADEVSNITIPTITGTNTLSVDTTLQPSEVTVNYKGWHPVADVHECNNGAWT